MAVPSEIKLFLGPQDNKDSSNNLLQKDNSKFLLLLHKIIDFLFYKGNVNLSLTFFGTSFFLNYLKAEKILRLIGKHLNRNKYMSMNLSIQIDYPMKIKDVLLLRRIISPFLKEAHIYQTIPRLFISCLTRIEGANFKVISEYLQLQKYLNNFKIMSCVYIDFYTLPVFVKYFKKLNIKLPIFISYPSDVKQIKSALKQCMEWAPVDNLFLTFHDIITRILNIIPKNRSRHKCNSGIQRLVFDSCGWVYPCYGGFIVNRKMGNIFMGQVEKSSIEPTLFSENKECQKCLLRRYCGGCLFLDDNTVNCDDLIDIFALSLRLRHNKKKIDFKI